MASARGSTAVTAVARHETTARSSAVLTTKAGDGGSAARRRRTPRHNKCSWMKAPVCSQAARCACVTGKPSAMCQLLDIGRLHVDLLASE